MPMTYSRNQNGNYVQKCIKNIKSVIFIRGIYICLTLEKVVIRVLFWTCPDVLLQWHIPYRFSTDPMPGLYLGIEFYLFVSHEGMKRQRFHV